MLLSPKWVGLVKGARSAIAGPLFLLISFVVIRGSVVSVGRRSKHSPAAEDAMVKAYELGGNDADAAKATGISLPTLYKWLSSYPELKERCEQAKEKSIVDAAAPIIDRLKQCEQLAEDYVFKLLSGEVKKRKVIYGAGGTKIERIEEEILYPSDRILERFLGSINSDDINFTLNIGLAEPDNGNSQSELTLDSE